MFCFAKNLPTTLIMQHQGQNWAIPMTGNAQYGWQRRRVVSLRPEQLESVGSIHMQRLVAIAQGVPEEYLSND